MATLSINEKIGNYWVKSIIRSNSYTETYRVEDADSHPYFLKLFLLKNLPCQLFNNNTKVVKEIEYSSRLNHRNIISFIEHGTITREYGDFQYYIYFNGAVLSDYVCRCGSLSEEESEKIFRNILSGMQYLHSQSPALLHNDINPSNIMISETNEEAVIIDLGHISERCTGFVHFDSSDLDIFYHANETGSGIYYDEQSDLFSVCSVLYYMLTSKAPWQTEIEGTNYKERLKVLWQYRKNTKVDIDHLNCSPKLKTFLGRGWS